MSGKNRALFFNVVMAAIFVVVAAAALAMENLSGEVRNLHLAPGGFVVGGDVVLDVGPAADGPGRCPGGWRS